MSQAASQLGVLAQAWRRHGDEVNTSVTGWVGDAADAATARRKQLVADAEWMAQRLDRAKTAVARAGEQVSALRHGVSEVEHYARAKELRISPEGQVTDAQLPQSFESQEDADRATAERQRAVDECVAMMEQVLRKAGDVDADLAAAFAAADPGMKERTRLPLGEFLGTGLLAPPDKTKGAAVMATWWASLTLAEQAHVMREHPEWLGNADGLPAAVRDQANRLLLPRYRAELQAHIDALNAARLNAEQPPDDWGTQNDAQLQLLQTKLEALNAVEKMLAKGDRQLLALDITHERAQAAIAVGDVDSATHVSVFTPGLTSTVQKMVGYDREMYEMRLRSLDLLSNDPLSSGESVAMVTWLGYQAPQFETVLSLDNSVVGSGTAQQGGKDLASFLSGIHTSREGDVDLVAVGHSYGSTTTGYATQNVEPGVVDRAIFYGSPGLGTNQPDDLRVPTDDIYVLEAKNDPVADLGRFGTDPNQLSVNHLETGASTAPDGTELKEVTGHVDYLNNQTTSQHNMAAVIADQSDQAVTGTDEGFGDGLREGLGYPFPVIPAYEEDAPR